MSATDKIKGVANEVIGKAKQVVGKIVGSDQTQIDGAVQETEGEAQVAIGKIKDTAKRGANAAADAINKNL